MIKVLDLTQLPGFKAKIVGLIPTKVSQVTNDSKYQTDTQVTTAITNAIAGVKSFEAVVVTELPTTGQAGVLYLKSNGAAGGNIFNEYLWVGGKYEQVGQKDIDLSAYALKTSIPTKITQLTNDAGFQNSSQVTTAMNKALEPYATSASVDTKLVPYALKTSLPTKVSQLNNDSGFQTSAQVDTKVTQSLVPYATLSMVTNALGPYERTTAVDSKLESYVTKTSLTSTLGSYATNGSVDTKLANYIKASDIQAISAAEIDALF